MNLLKTIAFIFIVLISNSATAQNYYFDRKFSHLLYTVGQSYNVKLFIPDLGLRGQKLNKKIYSFIFNRLEILFRSSFYERGETLIIDRKWSERWASAYSEKENGNIHIHITGALARHHEMTPLGFTLVGCHELGHYIGGVPYKSSIDRISTEGQADYFATLKCLRIFLKSLSIQEMQLLNLDELYVTTEVKNRCKNNFLKVIDQEICQLSSMAAMSLTNVFADIRGEKFPQLTTPESSIVESMLTSHPDTQCRLDTFFQGAICYINESILLDDKDPNIGTCNRFNGDKEGLRPLCWYKP